MQSRLKYAFGIAIAALVVLTIALAPDHPMLIKDKLNMHVMESNALYFKNLRQFYYDISEDERSGYYMYDHPDQKVFSEFAPRFKIVDNWRQDQAFIIFENTESTVSAKILEIDNGAWSKEFALKDLNAIQSLNLGVSIFESVTNDSTIFTVKIGNENVPIWNTPDQRRVVKTILKDYFKLVGAL